jgi:hypothetical protein
MVAMLVKGLAVADVPGNIRMVDLGYGSAARDRAAN